MEDNQEGKYVYKSEFRYMIGGICILLMGAMFFFIDWFKEVDIKSTRANERITAQWGVVSDLKTKTDTHSEQIFGISKEIGEIGVRVENTEKAVIAARINFDKKADELKSLIKLTIRAMKNESKNN